MKLRPSKTRRSYSPNSARLLSASNARFIVGRPPSRTSVHGVAHKRAYPFGKRYPQRIVSGCRVPWLRRVPARRAQGLPCNSNRLGEGPPSRRSPFCSRRGSRTKSRSSTRCWRPWSVRPSRPTCGRRLHGAAQRDDRLSELAFAFESVSQGKRLRASQPAVAAEFLFQAGRFFGDVFGDAMGAVTYLERALALSPGHVGAFATLEALLRKTDQSKKLAELYASAAQHRPRAEQASFLRRAAELLEQTPGGDERVMDLLQSILRLEPGDESARARLEALYVRANRFRDVVRMNEQALAAEARPRRRRACRCSGASSRSTPSGCRSRSAPCHTSSTSSRSIRRTKARGASRRSSWSPRASPGAPPRRSRRRSRCRARRRRWRGT